MKLNSLVLFRCHIQVRLLRLPQFTCALHLRAKCFLNFRGPKLRCALDSMAHWIRVNMVNRTWLLGRPDCRWMFSKQLGLQEVG
jgi:hypothetical protein